MLYEKYFLIKLQNIEYRDCILENVCCYKNNN